MNHLGMQSHPQDIDELCALAQTLADGNGPVRVVEIGTWVGATACRLADVGCVVTCIDTFEGTQDPEDYAARSEKEGEQYATFSANVGDRLWRNVHPQVGRTTDVPHVRGPFDLCFIDADHRYDQCLADIRRWEPCVRPGGLLCCHDYGWWKGVTRAVDEHRGDRFTKPKAGMSLAWWRV